MQTEPTKPQGGGGGVGGPGPAPTETLCQVCGEPMPTGESMFKFHGYSGPCPKPPLERIKINGVGRVDDNDRAYWFSTSETLSDDDLRDLHNYLRRWRGSAAKPRATTE